MENRCLSPGDFRRLPESNQDEIQAWLLDHGHHFRYVACIRLHDGNLILDRYVFGESGRPQVRDGAGVTEEVVVDCRSPFPWPGPTIRLRPLQPLRL